MCLAIILEGNLRILTGLRGHGGLRELKEVLYELYDTFFFISVFL